MIKKMIKNSDEILKIENLEGYYKGSFGFVQAVDGVSFSVNKGEIVGIAGESGCGKSTLAELITGCPKSLLYHGKGQVYVNEFPLYIKMPTYSISKFNEITLKKKIKKQREKVRKDILCKEIGYVPQASQNSLNPVKKVKKIINDVMKQRYPNYKAGKQINIGGELIQSTSHIINHLKKLGLDETILTKYPHELSGGMKQRTVVGISTLYKPNLLIVDEPTSALDVTTQKLLIDTLLDLLSQNIIDTIIFISHDIPTLAQICTRCIIMYAGKLIEMGSMEEIICEPLHPYTEELIHSIASFNPDGTAETELKGITGEPPNLRNPPKGCRFYPRCERRMDECKEKNPPYFYPKGINNPVACWLYKE
ncbi:MAG: ABC transporter ATP-binding protein [Promethearchaeota archaeon]